MSVARALLVLVVATASALAAPNRVLVADTDPELVHAIETTLAPWRMIVITEGAAVDPALVAARADAADAQFIVWREGAELVVYDRATGATERRPVHEGALDPVSAAAAALTVKTMMRLPEEPNPDETAQVTPKPDDLPAPPPAEVDHGHSARFHVGLGGRLARGSETELGGHGAFAAMVRPSGRFGWRVGLAGELRTDTDVDRSGFTGAASDEALFAVVSYARTLDRIDLEPWVGLGVVHSTLEGMEGMDPRTEDVFRPGAQLGVAVWWPMGGWGVGVGASAEVAFGTKTYTKVTGGTGMPVIYEVPRVWGALSLLFALGR